MATRNILHLDMDAFFVSVERRLDPALLGGPVIVGSDNPHGRGVVAAASYEARRYGVHSAMALRAAWRLCPQARFIAGHPEAYAQASRALRAICADVAPLVEMASIDEAYLDLSGTERLYGPAGSVADALQRRIGGELGLPASFGWGENKLLAKVASGRSKPHGLLRVYPGRGSIFLAPLALRRLPGIGPRSAAVLERYGLRRIGDLERLGERRLAECLGEAGRALYWRARGDDASAVTPERAVPRSVGREHTYETDTASREAVCATLSRLTERVAASLRRQALRARRVTLKLRYSDFKTVSRAVGLVAPSNDDRMLYYAAVGALEPLYSRRVRIRLVGLSAHALVGDAWRELDLFGPPDPERVDRLGHAIDAVRERYGFDAVLRGRSMIETASRVSCP